MEKENSVTLRDHVEYLEKRYEATYSNELSLKKTFWRQGCHKKKKTRLAERSGGVISDTRIKLRAQRQYLGI